MLIVFHTDVLGTQDLCRNTLVSAGARFIKEMDRTDIVRSDALIILISFKNDSFDDVIAAHPYNRKVVVTSSVINDSNTVVVGDIRDLPSKLRSLLIEEDRTSRPLMITSKQHNRRRVEIHKSKCPFCNRDIGDTTLGMQNHLTACQNYRSRPISYGHMVTIRQPNGRSKGSVLTVYIPTSITINEIFYE